MLKALVVLLHNFKILVTSPFVRFISSVIQVKNFFSPLLSKIVGEKKETTNEREKFFVATIVIVTYCYSSFRWSELNYQLNEE